MMHIMALLGQICLTCMEIHPRQLVPATIMCGGCESAIFCNKGCQALALRHHIVICQFLQAIQADPFFMPVRDIPPTTDPAEITIRPDVWWGRLQLAKWLIVRLCRELHQDFADSSAVKNAKLRYKLWSHFAFAARCGICYATKDITPCCTDCHMVFACNAHASQVILNHPDDICDGYRMVNGVHNFIFGYQTRTGREVSYVPRDPVVDPRPEEEGWPTFFKWRIPGVYRSAPPFSHPTFFHAAACKLSMSMTALFAARQFELVNTDPSFVVHVVGLSFIEGMPDETWEEIVHQLPQVKTLTVIAVKPDLVTLSGEDTFEQELCQSCNGKGRKCVFQAFGMLYHEYARQSEYKKPDLVIAFNVSFGDAQARAFWKPMIEFLVEADVPVCLTILSREFIGSSENFIEEIGAKIVTRFSENPYRGKEPMLNAEVMAKKMNPEMTADELFGLKNYFYLLFKGRK